MAQQQHTLAAKVAWCATSLIVIYLCVGKVSVAGKPGLAYPVLVFALSQALYYWMVSGACLALCCDIPLAMAHGMHQVVCSLYRTHVKDPFGRQVQFFHQAPNYQSIMEVGHRLCSVVDLLPIAIASKVVKNDFFLCQFSWYWQIILMFLV